MSGKRSNGEFHRHDVQRMRREIGARILEARIQSQQTQEQVAMQMQISRTSIACWEAGRYGFNLTTAIDLAEVLDTTVAYLVGEEEWGGGRCSENT